MSASDLTNPSDATDFWIDRGHLPKNEAAVSPGHSDSRLNNWTRGLLRDFTLRRARQHLGRTGTLVDLGCGYGDFTAALAPLADKVIACDVSPDFVRAARKRLASHPDATVTCEDVRTFRAFDSASLVYLGAVLMYFDDDDCLALLRDLRARLRPDGVVISRDWCAIQLGRETRNTDPTFSIHRRPARYAQLAAAAGLRVVESNASPSIYAEQLAHRLTHHEPATRLLRWPLRLLLRLATLPWRRASVTFVMKPA